MEYNLDYSVLININLHKKFDFLLKLKEFTFNFIKIYWFTLERYSFEKKLASLLILFNGTFT